MNYSPLCKNCKQFVKPSKTPKYLKNLFGRTSAFSFYPKTGYCKQGYCTKK